MQTPKGNATQHYIRSGKARTEKMNLQKVVKGYRFVTENLTSEHGETQWAIGEWQHQDGEIILCGNGFHASKNPLNSLGYVFGSRWFKCEAKGKIVHDEDKFCASDMRITTEISKTVIRRFAYECALHVLPIFEKYTEGDKRVRECLKAVQRFLNAPTEKNRLEMRAASVAAACATWNAASDARAAAACATWNAASDARAAAACATWDAEWAARAAECAASEAAECAASEAAECAASEAAECAASEAAECAAGAAECAVWAASVAARAAACAAWDASVAAGAAAWDAEWNWQKHKLNQLLKKGEV
jgi:hypothetical protein